MGAEFLFMDDNARHSPCKHCRQMPSIGGYHSYVLACILTVFESIEHVWDMLGRRISARQYPPTFVPELRRHCLMSGVIFPKIRLIILMLSMARRSVMQNAVRVPGSCAFRSSLDSQNDWGRVEFVSHHRTSDFDQWIEDEKKICTKMVPKTLSQ
ncbi:uncharacterized protein TNCV_4972131 [Trichonephila clavipes]|nr:uncharacterized protein TNCV_4972131 [Trichonephila clavipes]